MWNSDKTGYEGDPKGKEGLFPCFQPSEQVSCDLFAEIPHACLAAVNTVSRLDREVMTEPGGERWRETALVIMQVFTLKQNFMIVFAKHISAIHSFSFHPPAYASWFSGVKLSRVVQPRVLLQTRVSSSYNVFPSWHS